MSEAAIEFPRKKPQKGPAVVPLAQWKRQQAMKKAGKAFIAAGDTVLKTATAAGLAGIGAQAHPPGVEIVHASEQSSPTIEKKTYTDLLTKNQKDQDAARTLVDNQRKNIMGIVTNPYTAGDSKHLQVVMKDENKNKIIEAANNHNLPAPAVLAFALIENSGSETEVSKAGAAGIFQLTEPAAEEMGLTADERFTASKNIEAGVKYIALQRDRFGGDLGLAAIAYYIGPNETLKILNNHSRMTRGYSVISPEGSFDDPMGREIIANYLRTNHISAFSLLESEPTRKYFGEDKKGKKLLEDIKIYVPRVIAAAEYLVANQDVEPEKILVTIPNIPSSYTKQDRSGAVV